ncbi:MAG: 3-ketoacyl-ACP reductase [Pseudomonadota bacterium]|jgi:NAD(P)-dependent dehydrogenase (short-subunit alcohol dehydrogenase family)
MSAPVALVTGGQQGIGLGIARALKGAGFTIALASEQPGSAATVRAALGELGPSARYFTHDLQAIGSAADLVVRVTDALGPLATFVANAGVPARVRGDLLDVQAESFDFVTGINLRGSFFLAQAVAKAMLADPAPHYRSMTFVTSVSAAMASVERAEYCISKAGASMMARLFALRLAPHGIGVFELRPGIIETAMTAGVKETYDARIAEGLVPAGRWGTPGDIGSVMVPIATGQMAFATGAVIPVDGALSVARL